jgi:hypothetical protein
MCSGQCRNCYDHYDHRDQGSGPVTVVIAFLTLWAGCRTACRRWLPGRSIAKAEEAAF